MIRNLLLISGFCSIFLAPLFYNLIKMEYAKTFGPSITIRNQSDSTLSNVMIKFQSANAEVNLSIGTLADNEKCKYYPLYWNVSSNGNAILTYTDPLGNTQEETLEFIHPSHHFSYYEITPNYTVDFNHVIVCGTTRFTFSIF